MSNLERVIDSSPFLRGSWHEGAERFSPIPLAPGSVIQAPMTDWHHLPEVGGDVGPSNVAGSTGPALSGEERYTSTFFASHEGVDYEVSLAKRSGLNSGSIWPLWKTIKTVRTRIASLADFISGMLPMIALTDSLPNHNSLKKEVTDLRGRELELSKTVSDTVKAYKGLSSTSFGGILRRLEYVEGKLLADRKLKLEFAKLKASLAKVKEEKANSSKLQAAIEEKLTITKQELEAEKETRQAIEKENSRLRSELQAKMQELEGLKSASIAGREAFGLELKELKDKHAKELVVTKEKCEKKLSVTKEKYETALLATKKKYETDFEAAKDKFDKDLLDYKQKASGMLEDLSKTKMRLANAEVLLNEQTIPATVVDAVLLTTKAQSQTDVWRAFAKQREYANEAQEKEMTQLLQESAARGMIPADKTMKSDVPPKMSAKKRALVQEPECKEKPQNSESHGGPSSTEAHAGPSAEVQAGPSAEVQAGPSSGGRAPRESPGNDGGPTKPPKSARRALGPRKPGRFLSFDDEPEELDDQREVQVRNSYCNGPVLSVRAQQKNFFKDLRRDMDKRREIAVESGELKIYMEKVHGKKRKL